MPYAVKLQEFAREQGVTDRQIQRQLKKYAAELEGLFERRGPNGTWLSEEACIFLKSKMKRDSFIAKEREEQHLKQIESLKAEVDRFKQRELVLNKKVEEAEENAQKALKELTEAHQSFEDELKKVNEAYERELEEERQRKISFKEFLQRRINIQKS